jgi:hypothetical protein
MVGFKGGFQIRGNLESDPDSDSRSDLRWDLRADSTSEGGSCENYYLGTLCNTWVGAQTT